MPYRNEGTREDQIHRAVRTVARDVAESARDLPDRRGAVGAFVMDEATKRRRISGMRKE